MSASQHLTTINTTLGDLIAAVSDAALELSENSSEVYLLASLALGEILKKAPLRQPGGAGSSTEWVPEDTSCH